MIIPGQNHEHIVPIGNTKGIRLVTTKQGTYAELWSYKYKRPIKDGKLFLITSTGELQLFSNPNKRVCAIDPDTNTIKVSLY